MSTLTNDSLTLECKPSLRDDQFPDDVTLALNASKIVMGELYKMGNRSINTRQMVLDVMDFILLFTSAQLAKNQDMFSFNELLLNWEKLKSSFKQLQNKSPILKDGWKDLSIVVSCYFLRKNISN